MKQLIIWLILWITWPLLANEASDVKKGNEVQIKTILGLEQAIGQYHLTIQNYYKYIYKTGLIKNNVTRIPLLSDHHNYYQRKEKHIYSSEALIHWDQNKKVTYIHFRERNAISKTFRQIRREWLGQANIDGHDAKAKINGYSVDFITYDVSEYGNINIELFRINTVTDTKGTANFFKIPKHGVIPKPEVRFIENAQYRIEILQEYLKLMTLLDHRVKYFTTKARTGGEDRLRFLIP